MTEDPTVSNVATGDAHIGMQGVVHGDFYYQVSPDASPREKFTTGALLLDAGVRGRAWSLIHEALEKGYRTSKVCFYWRLALVSGRTLNELSDDEAALLRDRRHFAHLSGEGDEWADGVKAIDRLLDFAEKPEGLLDEFGKLGSVQRDMVLKHLELFLEGPLKDQVWARAGAELDPLSGDRVERAWKFFEREPTGPHRRPPRPPMVQGTTWFMAVMATAVLVAVGIQLGYLLIQAGRVPALLAYLVGIPAGCLGARHAVEWRFRTVRRQAKEAEYGAPMHRTTGGGFAKRVENRLEHYFARYVPEGVDRAYWLAETTGIRQSLRDEIVRNYREQRTSVEQIGWLIRHRVGQVRTQWQKGTFRSYRTELATPPATMARAVLGLGVLAVGGFWGVGQAVLAGPSSAAPSTALLLAAGWFAGYSWLEILLERRQDAADKDEADQAYAGDEKAFSKWQERLADKPTDPEMAAWLDCDRKILLSKALEHYRLAMSNVLAYAVIEAGIGRTKHARVRGGPWRYQGYRLLLFLLTGDGVRQVTVRLDFEKGTFHDRTRANYRYEAVAAVRVRHADDGAQTFELALLNGQKIELPVIDPGVEEFQPDEDPEEVTEVTLDAAGLGHTLHVLEGIAAEGKEWITREKERGRKRASRLAHAVNGSAPSP